MKREYCPACRWVVDMGGCSCVGATVKMLWEARQEISRLQDELARSALSAALKEMGAG